MTARRTLIFAALLFLAVLASAALHLYSRGQGAMAASDAAMARGDLRAACASAKDAAQARLPLSPFPARGRARLQEIAKDTEARGDLETATLALRALRAACASTTIGAPDPCAAEADQGLARVAARAGIAPAPLEDEIAPPAWLPLVVILALIGLVLLAARVKPA